MLTAFVGSLLVLWVFGLAASIFGGDLRGPAFAAALFVFAVIFLRERNLDQAVAAPKGPAPERRG